MIKIPIITYFSIVSIDKIIALIYRPKSVRNRRVTEHFVAPLCYFDFVLSVILGCLSYDCLRYLHFFCIMNM